MVWNQEVFGLYPFILFILLSLICTFRLPATGRNKVALGSAIINQQSTRRKSTT